MKNIFKYFLIAIVFAGFTSCEDSDNVIDYLYDNVNTHGAILRILSYPVDIVSISGGGTFGTSIDFTFEVQEDDGSIDPDFKEVRVYITSYDDQDFENQITDADGNEFGEVLYTVIPKADFDTLSDVNGLPMYNLSIPTSEFAGLFPGAEFTPPDFMYVRFELEMNNGSVYSVFNAGTTLSGPFFESPFQNTTIFLNI